jgi:hypothetical protein
MILLIVKKRRDVRRWLEFYSGMSVTEKQSMVIVTGKKSKKRTSYTFAIRCPGRFRVEQQPGL